MCCASTETAENIGYSCNMLREEMKEVFIVAGNTTEEVAEELRYTHTHTHTLREEMEGMFMVTKNSQGCGGLSHTHLNLTHCMACKATDVHPYIFNLTVVFSLQQSHTVCFFRVLYHTPLLLSW